MHTCYNVNMFTCIHVNMYKAIRMYWLTVYVGQESGHSFVAPFAQGLKTWKWKRLP